VGLEALQHCYHTQGIPTILVVPCSSVHHFSGAGPIRVSFFHKPPMKARGTAAPSQ
jgi:hypothetical protein